jgi:hypothetical protein
MPRFPYRPLARIAAVLLAFASSAELGAQRLGNPMSPGSLRLRLEAFAHDSMKGRMTGSPEHVKATRFLADEMRKLGLRPAGDSGSYLQKVPLVRTVLDSAATRVALGGMTLTPYADYLPRNQGPAARSFDGVPVVYAGIWGDPAMLRGEAVRGKAVLVGLQPDSFSVVKLAAQSAFSEAAAIIIANFDLMPPALREALAASPMQLEQPAQAMPVLPSYLHVPVATAARMLGVGSLAEATPGRAGTALSGRIAFRNASVEAYNVVAVLPGADATLRDEYVAVGAHSDHVGTTRPQDKDSTRAFNLELRRKQLANGGLITQTIYESIRVDMDSIRRVHPQPRLDSIYNGADDDGSGSMGLLEVARAFAAQREKPRRSILFIWHVGEELGLFGSEHFTDHPTVPRERIVAQVNIDMVGRGRAGEESQGGPDYLQLIGSRRLSTQLGDLVERVSTEKKFNWAFDYQYDATGHPEQFYCRSDHYMYARYGIPVVFMTTGGHADYHEVTDEVQHIDFEKLSKVSRFVHDLARAIADAPERPLVDKPKPDPRGQCTQ